ncbi:MAG: DNA polymerase Y family protein [Hyphomicrobiaceae bacterium]|nr:DNA polymerase Y family protein [Hyphomicrobiaceae bacterium]
MTRIVSVWLPAWPIERMQRQSPGRVPATDPLALVEKGARGLRISAVNRAALVAGVKTGSPLADARAALPALAVRPAEHARDAHALSGLAGWLGRYGPLRNVDGIDGAWIDVSGVPHLFGGEAALCADLERRLRGLGLSPRIGLADTFGAAHALARLATSDAPAGSVAIAAAGTTKAALAGLPVAALRLAPDALRLLIRLGLKRVGQLYGLPRASLAARFRETSSKRRGVADTIAASVLLRLDQALGLVADPQRPLLPPPESQSRLAFPEPLITSEGIMAALDHLALLLTDTLAAQALGARHFRLTLYRADGTVATVGVGTSSVGRDPTHIRRLMGERLGGIDAGFGIDVATLDAAGLEPLGAVQTGLGARHDATDGAAALIDRLVNRLGPERVLRLSPHASHIPEGAESWVPTISADPRSRTSPGAIEGGCGSSPRPLLLLAPPEPIGVIAELPEGAPLQFVWRRVPRRIVKSEGPERIAPEWWRHVGMPSCRRSATRDYYRLEDATGARYWVFREGLYGRAEEDCDEDDGEGPRWFMHGLFA